MIWNNRFLKIIVLSLGTFLLIINVVIWANNSDILSSRWDKELTELSNFKFWDYYSYNTEMSMTEYRGFRWFFARLETYPGLSATLDFLNKFADVVNQFNVTDNVFLDALLAIFRVLFTPVLLIFTVVADLYRNVKWFIEFVVFNPIKPIDLH